MLTTRRIHYNGGSKWTAGNVVDRVNAADGEIAHTLTSDATIDVDIYPWIYDQIMVGGVEKHVHVDISCDVDNPFIDAYLGSIK